MRRRKKISWAIIAIEIISAAIIAIIREAEKYEESYE